MDNLGIEEKIKEIALEICDREGFKLYDLEYLATQKIVRVFIDSPEEKEGGVTLDDCAKISQGMNLMLDVEDLILSSYNLEVSSPGLERALKEKWHYEKQVGNEIKVVIKARTKTAQDLGTKNLKGTLNQVNEESFLIETQKGKIELPYEDVHKCNVVFNF